jgi:hypothetical protein
MAISVTLRFSRVKSRITARCSSLDIWFMYVHKDSERTILSTET